MLRPTALIVLLILSQRLSVAANGEPYMGGCRTDLGMHSGAIPDTALTASSSYDEKSVGPQNSRIRLEKNGGAWCPKTPIGKELREWLQIDLQEIKVITLVETQGRFGNGQGQEFAPNYVLEYQRQENGRWMRYRDKKGTELIKGNGNTYIPELRELRSPIIARSIRLIPWSSHPRTACMRVELYGCSWSDGVISYDMRQGDTRSHDIELFDFAYDGENVDGFLSGGLGQLTDFEEGNFNFRLDHYNVGKRGYEWVGWKNETNSTRPVDIVFHFDVVRNFTGVQLHVNNLISKEVSVFRRLVIDFSPDGSSFSPSALVLDYAKDTMVENVRNVFVTIPHRTALVVKLSLFFDSRWLLISEVRFFSKIVHHALAEINDIKKEDNKGKDLMDESAKSSFPVIFLDSAQLNKVLHPNFSSALTNIGVNQSTRFAVNANARVWENFDEANIGIVVGIVTGILLILAIFLFLVLHRRHGQICGRGSSSSLKLALFSQRKSVSLQLDPLPTTNGSKTSNGLIYRSIATNESNDSGKNIYDPEFVEKPLPDDPVDEPEITSMTQGSIYEILPTFCSPEPNDSFTMMTSVLPPNQVSIPDSLKNGRQSSTALSVLCTSWKNETMIPEIQFQNLIFIEKLGEGLFGEVHLCQVASIEREDATQLSDHTDENASSLVAVKILRKNHSEQNWLDFQKEMKILSNLKDPNILQLFGWCTKTDTPAIVLEYMIHGDLFQFLRNSVLEDSSQESGGKLCLSYGSLIFMAMQIASGMKYLESLNLVHRDLAARNCLVGQKYKIKIADFGMSRSIYSNDYCDSDGGKLLPIRWMAWESILLGRFSCKTDVWSFGVTLWEILGLACETPFSSLKNDEVIDNCEHIRINDGFGRFLSQPLICPKEMYDLMMQCWSRDEAQRPTFREIHMFLQHRNIGYTPDEVCNLQLT